MNYRRLLFVCMATISVATPCLAASEINVQFGSYETRDEAEKRVSDITSAHKNDLGGKAPAIREVKLPPDNLTVFRTQAGPYDSRATAQSICQKLSSTGDECYVVESAVASPVAPTPVAPAPVAAAAPPPPAPAAPAPVVTAPAPPPLGSERCTF